MALCCLFLSSCVTDSQNPLSSPETAHADQRLLGDWVDKEDHQTIRFTMKKEAPWMQGETVDDKTGEKTDYDFFPAVIGGTTFLNVRGVTQDAQGHPSKNYVFYRYTISPDNVLQMWGISQDAALAAVRAGKLKGIVHEDKNSPPNGQETPDVTLLDTSENLVKFIQGTDATALFNEKSLAVYRDWAATGNK